MEDLDKILLLVFKLRELLRNATLLFAQSSRAAWLFTVKDY